MKIRVEISSLATNSPSGVGNYTKLLTEALDNNPRTEVLGSYFNFLNRQSTPNIKLKKRLEKNSLLPLRVYAKLQSYGIAPPFDTFLSGVDLTIFPNFATWPTVKSRLCACVVHDLTYLYFPELTEEKNLAHLRRVIPCSIRQADFIITVSEAVKSELVKEFSLDPDKCIVTNIPPDSTFFKKNGREIHKKYGIPTKKFILFIGTLEPRKDLPTLIAAYQKLPKKIKDEYSLVMAGGNGWKTEKSREAIKSAQKDGEKVIHVGYINKIDSPAFYQKASLLVVPSVYEGFGMPILEAMASNTPVVASDIPVLRETGDDAAIYANMGDPSDFCKKITTVLSDQNLVKDLNKKASARLKKMSWDKNAENIINYANKLLN